MKKDQESLYALPFFVEEQYLCSKTGKMEDCEDALYVGNNFVAVIDGATSKTARRWNGETGGKVAACLLHQALGQLSYDAMAQMTVDKMNATLQDFYKQHGVLETVKADPLQRATASVVVVSFWRREIWLIGDCQCLLGHERISNDKLIDRISSEVRALFLETEILKGITIEALRQEDTGRDFIFPLLERQMLFQNNPSSGKYWYPVIDGFSFPNEGVIVRTIPDTAETIIIATDGYPILKESLDESEIALHDILLKDPLLFREYKSTKGFREGCLSFDDRAFIKLRLKRA